MLENKNDSIVIIGAGIFGLSTALYLARDGYTHVTILDRKKYNLYDPYNGCDAASADLNKIFRASYGDQTQYQRLAYIARDEWQTWNKQIASTPSSQLPTGLLSTDKLYTESGFLRFPFSQDEPLSAFERDGLSTLTPANRSKNYIIDDPDELARAHKDGWSSVLENAVGQVNWKGTGVLDATAGYVRADKACIWLAHLAREAGVTFIEDELHGHVTQLVQDDERVIGVKTTDGQFHKAVLTIVAGGGWTPSLVPAVRDRLETTAGSLISLRIPSDRHDLLSKFCGQQWPVICRNYTMPVSDGAETYTGMIYSLPHTDGVVKVGYRTVKFTNYTTLPDGARISTPVTAYTSPIRETNIPLIGIEAMKAYIREHMPELTSLKISQSRLCWYTDSIDNHFLIDYVPGSNESLFVASGGSGHGFKFAPILGAHVLDAINHRSSEFTEMWKWRPVPMDRRNGLEEGESGPRVLNKQRMASSDDWTF